MIVRHSQKTQGLLLTVKVLQQPLFFISGLFPVLRLKKMRFGCIIVFVSLFIKKDVRPLAAVRRRHLNETIGN